MKRNHSIILGAALLALPSMASAQQTQPKDTTMNRTVVVEQEYNPDIMDASKVNVLPKVEEPTVSKKAVEYATSLMPATSIPAGMMKPYTGKEVRAKSTPGYARLGYGNYNNLDVKANYLFTLSERDKLSLDFGMDGMNGKLKLPEMDGEKWKARYYRTQANLDFTHQFNKLDLNFGGNFGLSNFNYLPTSVFGKQKFTSGDVRLGVKSTDGTLPLQFRAETALMLYDRQHNLVMDAAKETLVRTNVGVTGAINDEQQVGIAFQMNNLIYNTDYLENHTDLDLNPYYELYNDDWMLHLGANVDLAFGYGKSVRVSPDVTAQYVFSDSYVLYAKATGGRQVNDFRRLERVSPYGLFRSMSDNSVPSIVNIYDTYEQLNTSLGFKASPFPGVWFNLYGGYQNLKDDLFAYGVGNVSAMEADYQGFGQANTDNVYAGAKVNYQYKDYFTLTAEGTYYHWKAKENPLALLMKPSFDLKLRADVHPIPALDLFVDYQYTSREDTPKDYSANQVAAVSDLSLGASYTLFKGISVYARINNLLNKKYQYYYGYPTEGINFLGGLSFQF